MSNPTKLNLIGTLAERPPASLQYKGKLYRATDAGVVYRCNDAGTAWVVYSLDGMPIGPVVRLGRTTQFTLNSTSSVSLPWEVEREDTGNMFNLANPTLVTIPSNGLYAVYYRAYSTPGNTGFRQFSVLLNGTAIAITEHGAINSGLMTLSFLDRFNANDVLNFNVRNSAAGGVVPVATFAPFAEVIRMSD